MYLPIMLGQLPALRRQGARSIVSLQASCPASTLRFMQLFGALGDEYCYFAVIPFVYLGVDHTLGFRMLALWTDVRVACSLLFLVVSCAPFLSCRFCFATQSLRPRMS